jgi:transposase-like protein
VKGQWRYLYRAVDRQGQTVDFPLSKNRDKAAALRFFRKAIGNNEVPEKITLDGSRASHQASAELKAEGVLPDQTLVRTNKYLNYVANSVMWRRLHSLAEITGSTNSYAT